jgi:hypothetical protein
VQYVSVDLTGLLNKLIVTFGLFLPGFGLAHFWLSPCAAFVIGRYAIESALQ